MKFYAIDIAAGMLVHYTGNCISAGFPSPADDYLETTIDLSRELIRNPSATFLGRVRGLSMRDAGIDDNDILVVDRSLEPSDGRIAVCFLDGGFTLKRIRIRDGEVWLVPANSDFRPVRVTEDNDFTVWGIVTYIIKDMRKR